MTQQEFSLFLLGSAILCAVMAIFNLVRAQKKGTRGYFLSAAFIAVGAALLLYRSGYSTTVIFAIGALAFMFLVGDFVVRAKSQVLQEKQK